MPVFTGDILTRCTLTRTNLAVLSTVSGFYKQMYLNSAMLNLSVLSVKGVCVCVCVRARAHVRERPQSCPALLRPRGLPPASFLCSCDFPGTRTGVGCRFLLHVKGVEQIKSGVASAQHSQVQGDPRPSAPI